MLTLDHSLDYRIWVNRETVTLTQVDLAGDTITSGIDAKRRPVGAKEAAASFGVYTQTDTNWYLPATLVTGRVRPRDRITDADGTVFTVLEAPLLNLGSIWKCVSRDLVLTAGLRDLVAFQRPTNAQDAAGNREPTFATLAQDVPARVQETARTVKDALGRRVTEVTYSVWVDRTLAVTHEDRVLWTPAGESSPRVLEIQGTKDAENIQALFMVEAVWRGF